MAIECFKILNKLSPSCLHDIVVFEDCKYKCRYSNIVDIPRVRTSTYGKNSFKYAAAVLWNDLPDDYIPAPRRGSGVYCFTSVRPSVRPRYFSSHFSQ